MRYLFHFKNKGRMRRPERIPIMLEIFQDNSVKSKFIKYLFPSLTELGVKEVSESWQNTESQVEDYWKENPDLRLTQVLIGVGLLPNSPGFWFHTEEDKYVIENKIKEPREVLFWGQNYDKEMNLLPETRYILIKDMATDHIEAIIRDCNEGRYAINEFYIEVFNKEIKSRKNGKT